MKRQYNMGQMKPDRGAVAYGPCGQGRLADFIESLCAEYQKHNQIDPAFYERYRVKRGLRNADGTGVAKG